LHGKTDHYEDASKWDGETRAYLKTLIDLGLYVFIIWDSNDASLDFSDPIDFCTFGNRKMTNSDGWSIASKLIEVWVFSEYYLIVSRELTTCQLKTKILIF